MNLGSYFSLNRPEWEAVEEPWLVEEQFVEYVTAEFRAGSVSETPIGFRLVDSAMLKHSCTPTSGFGWLPAE